MYLKLRNLIWAGKKEWTGLILITPYLSKVEVDFEQFVVDRHWNNMATSKSDQLGLSIQNADLLSLSLMKPPEIRFAIVRLMEMFIKKQDGMDDESSFSVIREAFRILEWRIKVDAGMIVKFSTWSFVTLTSWFLLNLHYNILHISHYNFAHQLLETPFFGRFSPSCHSTNWSKDQVQGDPSQEVNKFQQSWD